MAQPGSAPVLGTGGRRFKSGHPDFRASSSGGQSNGLLSRGSGVRVPSGAPCGRRRAIILVAKPGAIVAGGFDWRVVSVAQHGRAPGCGLGGRGFKSLHSPHPSCEGGSLPYINGGPLAQSVEQLTLNQRVWSSSLQRPTKKPQRNEAVLPSQHGHGGNL